MFPVIEVRTRVMGNMETTEMVAMFGCVDSETAVASFPKKPSETVKFVGWDDRYWDYKQVDE